MVETTRILATLDEYAAAYCAKDLDRLMAIFVDGEGLSLIGTGADELCAGREAVSAVFAWNFRDATATRFEWDWRDVAVHGDAATVAATMNIHLETDDGKLSVPVRWTVSLILVDGDWRWVHRHASSAAVSQEAGTAYPGAGGDSK